MLGRKIDVRLLLVIFVTAFSLFGFSSNAFAVADYTIENTTDPSDFSAAQGSTNNYINAFLTTSGGGCKLQQITVITTGTASVDAVTWADASNVPIASSPAPSGDTWTVGSAENLGAATYHILVDIDAAGSGDVTAYVSGGTAGCTISTNSDAAGTTLTISAGVGTTTLADAADLGAACVNENTTDIGIGAFTLQTTTTPTDEANTIVVTGTNTANVATGGVKIWRDDGDSNWEGSGQDTQVGSGEDYIGNDATFSSLTENIGTGVQLYFISISTGASVTHGQTMDALVSNFTMSANTEAGSDSTDSLVTIDTAAPTGGTISNPTRSGTQCDLTWGSASDVGCAGLDASPYQVRWIQSATPPADCTSGAILYNWGSGTSTSHSTLSPSTDYAYRLCYRDALGYVASATTTCTTDAINVYLLDAQSNAPAAGYVNGTESDVGISAFAIYGDTNETVSEIVVTGAGLDDVSGVRLWLDTGNNTYDSGADTPLGAAISYSGSVATFGSLTQSITTGTSLYFISHDMDGVSVTNAVAMNAYVSGWTATNATQGSDNNDNSITVDTGAPVLQQVGVTGQTANSCSLSWSAVDGLSGLNSGGAYKVVWAAGTSEPADCNSGSLLMDWAATTSTTHVSLSPASDYSYRACFRDDVYNESTAIASPYCTTNTISTNIGDGGNFPSNAYVKASQTDVYISSFTLYTDSGTDEMNAVTISGDFLSTTNISEARLYYDNDTNGYDAGDTLLETSLVIGSTIVFDGMTVAIDNSSKQYVIVLDIEATPNDEALTAFVSDITLTTYPPNYLDDADATMTIDSSAPTSQTITKDSFDESSCTLSWSATDSGSGMHTSLPYKVVWELGGTPPTNTDCSNGTVLFNWGTTTNTTHSGRDPGTTYGYRACFQDKINNISTDTVLCTTTTGPCDDTIVSCTECHSLPPQDGVVRNATTGAVIGNHDNPTEHVAGTASTDCVRCHGSAVTSYSLKHRNDAINMSSAINGSGVYSKGTSFAQDGSARGTCSAVYCHGKSNNTPTWGTGGSINCSSCHTSQGAGGTEDYTLKHVTHVNATTYDFSCELCHSSDASSAVTHASGNATSARAAEVKFSDSNSGTTWTTVIYDDRSATAYRERSISNNPHLGEAVSTASYTEGGSSGNDKGFVLTTDGTCSAVWCHSNANPAGKSNVYTTPAFNAATSCTFCHGGAATSASVSLSYHHDTHIATDKYTFVCDECHKQTVQGPTAINATTGYTYHVNGIKNIGFAANMRGTSIDQTGGAIYNSGVTRVCSNLYCHSDGQDSYTPVYTPNWTSGTATCTTCHDDAGTSTNLSYKHINHLNTSTYAFSCNECHRETVAGSSAINATNGYDLHVNGTKNIGFAASMRDTGLDQSAATYSSGPKQCNSLYCHSNAQDDGGNSGYTSTTPDWDLAAPGCGTSCHGNPPATPTSSGAHVTHVTTNSFPCSTCHNGGGAGVGNYANHVNYELTFGVTSGASATYSQGSHQPGSGGYGRCSNTYCHGVESPLWGTNHVNDLCTRCHGENVAGSQIYQRAPGGSGVDTGGQSAATDDEVGAHQTHLRSLNDLRADIECAECHTVPTAVSDAGHNDSDLPAEITFNATGLSTNFGNLTPTYTAATGVCSGVYCHNTAFTLDGFSGNTAGTGNQPVWNNDTYLDGAMDATDCGRCHGYPPNPATGHADDTGCGGCHDGTVDTDNLTILGGASGITNHMDGAVVGGGDCDSCHKAKTGVPTENLAGRHATHYDSTVLANETSALPGSFTTSSNYVFNCGTCHDVEPFGGLDHNDADNAPNARGWGGGGYVVDIIANLPWAPSGQRINGTYSGGSGRNSGDAGINFEYYTDATCSAFYCHSNANPTGGTNVYTTPTWHGASATCTYCHSGRKASGYAATDLSEAHDRHTASDRYNFTCDNCHAGTVSDNTRDSILDKTWHVNGVKNIVLTTTALPASIDLSGASITGTGATRRCSTFYCHSDGTSTASTTGGSPPWPGSTSSCTNCHDDAGTSTNLSFKHINHTDTSTYALSCNECHRETVAGSSAINTTNGFDFHVNGIKNIGFAASMRDTGLDQSGGTYSSGPKQCGSLYCHSDVQSNDGTGGYTSTVPDWDGAQTCGTSLCHGNPPATPASSGAHVTHVTDNSFPCSTCHNGGGVGVGNYANHVDYVLTFGVTSGASATYTQGSHQPGSGGYGRCSNTYCHGVESPLWGTNHVNDQCTRCHGENVAGSQIYQRAPGGSGVDTGGQSAATDDEVGAHQAHLRSLNNLRADLECAECHIVPTAVSDSGHNDSDLPAEITFNATGLSTNFGNLTPTYTVATGVCSGVYCHNTDFTLDGISGDTGGSGTQPVWNNDTYLDGAMDATDCGRCHGYPPDPSGTSHPNDTGCSSCHGGTVDTDNLTILGGTAHIDGEVIGGGECPDCHANTQGPRRQITGAGGDFVRNSRHVNDGTTNNEIVTNWDCVICHLEGSEVDGKKDGTYHNAGSKVGDLYAVDLRDVDIRGDTAVAWNRNASPVTTSMRDDLDSFCMNCHDDDGASDISVNNNNPPDGVLTGDTSTIRKDSGGSNLAGNPTVNLRPFNVFDTLQNNNDKSYGFVGTIGTFRTNYSTGYGRVLDIKSKFNYQNLTRSAMASHHNLNQFAKRYDTRDSSEWPAVSWTTYVTKEGVTMNSATGAELAGLHCSDCHLNEVNAHGSVNSWYMLVGKNFSSDDDVAPTLDTVSEGSSVSHENVCFRCHSSAVYAGVDGGSTGGTNSRNDHSSQCALNRVGNTGNNPHYPFSIRCLACHAGFSTSASGGLGAIHGNNEDYYPGEGATVAKRYRFMAGATLRFYNPTENDATYSGISDWETAGGSMAGGGCYHINNGGTGDLWAGGCTQHDGGGQEDAGNFTGRSIDY